MLTLLPVGFILAASLLVLLIRNAKRGVGYAWGAAFLAALLTWGGVLALHWLDLPTLAITPWRPFEQTLADQIVFHLDAISWPYAMALASLNLAVIFSSPVRLQFGGSPVTWATNLAFTGFGLLGLLATSPIALVIAWMVIDLVELIYLLSSHIEASYTREIVVSFSSRLIGTFLVLAALALSRSSGAPLTFETAGPTEGLLILIAVAFRMGLFPVNLPVFHRLPLQRGPASTALIVIQLTGLIPLARMNNNPAPAAWRPILMTLTILACFYAALLWLTSRDELAGRSYWSLAFAGLAVLASLAGQSAVTLVWGLLLATAGGVLWLYSVRGRGYLVLPLLALLSFMALPFTPAAQGWQIATTEPGTRIVLILVLFLLAIGYIRHAWRPEPRPAGIENWGNLTYSLGLFVLGSSAWVIAFLGLPGGLSIGWWPGGLAILLLTAGSGFLFARGSGLIGSLRQSMTWYATLVSRMGNALNNFLRLGWLYKLFAGVFRVVQFFLLLFEGVFEGNGGVLWSLLILALLLTFLGSGALIR